VLRALDAGEGNFVNQAGVPSQFSKNINAGGGEIALELSNPGAIGSSGAGSIASAVFEVLAAAASTQIKAGQAAAVGAAGQALPVNTTAPLTLEIVP
jgi:hypothetical protein